MNSELLRCFALCCTFLFIVLSRYASYSQLRKYNVRLKMKLTDLALKTNNEIYAVYKITDEDKAKILKLKSQKRRIDAIKLLKSNYHMDLFEAKAYMDCL